MIIRLDLLVPLRARVVVPPVVGTGVWFVQETYALVPSAAVLAVLTTAVGLLTGQLAAVRRERATPRPGTREVDTGTVDTSAVDTGTVDTEHVGVDCAGRCVRIVERVHLSGDGRVTSRHVLSSEECR